MVEGLLADYNFTGWTRGRVLQLLGPGDIKTLGAEEVYDLGPVSAATMSRRGCLVVRFDNRGIVAACGMRTEIIPW